jgi:exopolysaccharide production protein ExoQ
MYQTVSMRYGARSPTADTPVRVPMGRPEKFFHILTMMTQFGAVVPLFLYLTGNPDADTEVGDSSPANSVMMATILIVSLILAFRYRDNIIRAIPGMAPVLCFLALAILSAAWSDYPAITLRRSGTAITTALWGAYLASRFSMRDIVVLIASSIGIIAVASMIAGLLFPDIGVNVLLQSDPDGVAGWKGVVSDKNSLGIVMATGTVTMLYLAISQGETRRRKMMWLGGMLLCGMLLYLSQSRTSWVSALAGIVCCGVVRAMYRRPAIGVVVVAWIFLLALPGMLLVMRDLSVLTSLIGKDATLTGRVDLWNVVLPYGDQRPWFGYGYGAFWIEDSPRTQEIWNALNSYKPPHAHNGWIETYLELGLIGCAVVAVQLLQMLKDAARASSQGRDVDAPYMLLVVVMMLIFNMVEADLIRAPALFWPFLIIGPVAMAKVMREKPRGALAQANAGPRLEAGPPLVPARLNLAAPPPLKSKPSRQPPFGPLRPSPLGGH